MGKRVLIVGATGMVGGYALQICLEHPQVSGVTVLGRRTAGVRHDKLLEVPRGNTSAGWPVGLRVLV